MSEVTHALAPPACDGMQVDAHRRVIAVVIPCYKVAAHVVELIGRIGPEVDLIFAVDDGCPQGSGNCCRRSATIPGCRWSSTNRTAASVAR
jgi:hypothetical protein